MFLRSFDGWVLDLNFDQEKKNRKYRYSLEIVRDILLIASARARKTRIMYQANLSYRLMEKYLKNLLESGLVECEDSCYSITRKGKDFLQMYADYLERRSRISEQLKGASKDKILLENFCFYDEGKLKRIVSGEAPPL